MDPLAEFVQNRVAPGAIDRDRLGEFDRELVLAAGESGLFRILVPAALGGLGAGHLAWTQAIAELGAVDASLAVACHAHVTLGIAALLLGATPAVRERWLPGALSGQSMLSFALTEPEAGSDLAGIAARAERTPEGWAITGEKVFISGGSRADAVLVAAATGAVLASGRQPLSIFLVPRSAGYQVGARHDTLGLRALDTVPIRFAQCRVPADHLVGTEGQGHKILMQLLTLARVSVAALATGILRACLDRSREYVARRVQFGRPLNQMQAIQFKLADMFVDLEVARTAVLGAAQLLDQGKDPGVAASVAKLFATEGAVRAAGEAVQLHGANGYTREYHVERMLRDARALTIGEGTSEMQRHIIAKHLGC